jgi:hypothetical protein
MRFVLHELLDVGSELKTLPGHAEVDADTINAVLEEAGKFASKVLFPLNAVGDREGCTLDRATHEVSTPQGFGEAYRQYVDGGWPALACDPEYGGQGLPVVVQNSVAEMFNSANQAWYMYPGLSHGAYECLHEHGTPEQKALYLPKLVSGEWTGTMCLTEPHCGTDLGLLRTRALPQADGSCRITGNKIFISAGEHSMAGNILHLVLARLPDAPKGTKGISLFLVPKYLPDAAGNAGARNTIHCDALEEKMGIHGNSTCQISLDDATGWLIGEPNKGLNAMFVMMNEARLGVAIQGLAQSEVAYQNAVAYARDRVQGRALTGAKEPAKAADPIIVHPDVRRTLLSIRAFNEAARALVLWTALKSDVAHRSEDAKARQEADDHLGLMTPVLKGVLTDRGFENAVAAQQMFGGHGYIEEWGMSQFVRDARIAMIYEGANGIQALDLVGRKLPRDGGRAVMSFFNEVQGFIKAGEGEAALKPLLGPLAQGLGHLQQATMWFMQNAMAKPDNAGAGSTDYMHLFGLVALGYMWAMQAKAAHEKLAAGANGDAAALETKLALARVFMERLMPETGARLARITAGADGVMALPAEMF